MASTTSPDDKDSGILPALIHRSQWLKSFIIALRIQLGHYSASDASDETQPWNCLDTPIFEKNDCQPSPEPSLETAASPMDDPAEEGFTESNEEVRDSWFGEQ